MLTLRAINRSLFTQAHYQIANEVLIWKCSFLYLKSIIKQHFYWMHSLHVHIMLFIKANYISWYNNRFDFLEIIAFFRIKGQIFTQKKDEIVYNFDKKDEFGSNFTKKKMIFWPFSFDIVTHVVEVPCLKSIVTVYDEVKAHLNALRVKRPSFFYDTRVFFLLMWK